MGHHDTQNCIHDVTDVGPVADLDLVCVQIILQNLTQSRVQCFCGEMGHRSAGCPEGKGKGINGGKGQFELSHTSKGVLDKGFNKGRGKQDDKGYGKVSSGKGKGLYGKGSTYAVLEQQDWSQRNGYTEGEGEGAVALFNLTDSSAGKAPILSRSSEPMRVDLRDFIKPKNGYLQTQQQGEGQDVGAKQVRDPGLFA